MNTRESSLDIKRQPPSGVPHFAVIYLLFLLFLGLKLSHQIDWSWWLVCAPIWIPFVGISAIVFIVTASDAIRQGKRDNEKN